MARNLLSHDSLTDFLEILATRGEVHGPVLTDDGVLAFRPVNAAADLQLDYHRTLIPPKKYLLQPRETMLTYAPDQGYRLPASAAAEIILIGLHPCDLQGIAYLDTVFLGDMVDPLYRARRNALTLIGLSCEADEFCFCSDLADAEMHWCDLFMRHVAGGFQLCGETPKGMAILERLTPHLVEGEPLPAASRTCDLSATIRQASDRGERFE
ncbi:MAG TPA: 4Fe-4S ferredoxin, partial [Geobacteraceae bacterium]|nr:4Fe-4S ferredoxin [Geobacteraceae bacterium]